MNRERQKVIISLSVAYLLIVIGFVLWWTKPRIEVVSVPAPTVTATIKVTLPPKTLPPRVVTKTIRVTERASRSQVARTPAFVTRSSGSSKTLACIRKYESTNNYRAVSASGTYRGAYQMSRVYSPAWAKRAGYDTWAGKTADKWPPAVQDAVAAHMGRSGWGHWSKHTSYNCPGF